VPRQYILIHVAVGIVINQDTEVLIAERPPQKSYPGLWEFPGGKVEPGESVYEALKREFQEEIDIQIISANPWFQIKHDYADRTVLLDIWMVTNFTGIPRGAEMQKILWAKLAELAQFEFPEGNKEIISRLIASNLAS
jgi:8-oxo-dGTP diphosphatase